MNADSQAAAISKVHWAGRIMSAVPILLLLASGAAKLVQPEGLVEELDRLGYAENLILGIGILEIACTAVYAIPRTAVLGAILLTGFLGGATATHVRIGDPFITPVVLGILVWGGLVLRDARLRDLVLGQR